MAYTPDAHLSFSQPRATDGHLTFGSADAPVSATGICTIAVKLPALRVSARFSYDNRVRRGPALSQASGWQTAQACTTDLRAEHHQAPRLAPDVASGWRAGAPATREQQISIHTLPHLPAQQATAWQRAQACSITDQTRWVQLKRAPMASSTHWQNASRISAGVLDHWRELDHRQRLSARSAWQSAAPLGTACVAKAGRAKPLPREVSARWQNGIPPAVGRRFVDPVIPLGPVCYERSGHLTFKWPTAIDGHLTFICDNALAPGEPKRIIPIRSAYIVINNVTLIRVDTGRELVCEALDVTVDADSWTCSWSATLAWYEFDALRAERGQPVELLASFNGHSYKLQMEGAPRRQRSFGKWSVSIHGRGIAAALDSPYQDISVRSNPTQAMTAQQIMADALTINGVSNGWAIDWQITDWLVPAGAWSHQGTPISAVLEVASAVGAIVQAADAAKTLRILPRYPIKPWAWSSANPDIQIPLDVMATDSVEPIIRPPYNAVLVGGQSYGLTSTVKRTGTAGDVPAPAVTHPLLTAPEATLQRGLAILGDTGAQERIGMSLPLSDDTGLIRLNMLADVPDPDDPWRGLVRNVALSAKWEDQGGLVVWQNIGLERHYAN